jgi:hypothetical protein
MTDMEAAAEALETAMKFARASGTIASLFETMTAVAKGLGDLVDVDPDLAPEVRAALTALDETTDALVRAGKFIEARAATALERIDLS